MSKTEQYPHMPDTSSVLLSDSTIDQIIGSGNRMADDGQRLEKQIWAVRAESFRQLAELCAKFVKANNKNELLEDLAKKIQTAASRTQVLSKLSNSARSLRNRAIHFGDLNCDPTVWDALSTVFENREKDEGPALGGPNNPCLFPGKDGVLTSDPTKDNSVSGPALGGPNNPCLFPGKDGVLTSDPTKG